MSSAKEKYSVCLKITSDALGKLKVVEDNEKSRIFLKFANDYYSDAVYYANKGEYATALEAIAYAHGFIDAGVLCGFFKIDGYHLEEVK